MSTSWLQDIPICGMYPEITCSECSPPPRLILRFNVHTNSPLPQLYGLGRVVAQKSLAQNKKKTESLMARLWYGCHIVSLFRNTVLMEHVYSVHAEQNMYIIRIEAKVDCAVRTDLCLLSEITTKHAG
jgi:hypothetical protein